MDIAELEFYAVGIIATEYLLLHLKGPIMVTVDNNNKFDLLQELMHADSTHKLIP